MNYYKKDCIKFIGIDKLISIGCQGSSSDRYSKIKMANTGEYTETDRVGISVNGARANRVKFDILEILKAIKAKVRFITDNGYHTSRNYNIGEREVQNFLRDHNYIRTTNNKYRAVWTLRFSDADLDTLLPRYCD